MKRIVLKALVAFGGLILAMPSQAGLVFTIENPGVQASTVPGVVTENFNSYPLGPFSGSIAVGTLSSGGVIRAPDSYGGANATRYYSIDNVSSATLTLTSPQYYFGMWWPAGDAYNQLEFYDNSTLLASYKVGDIIPHLSSAYYGNPNNGQDPSEPFVYLDFTTTAGDAITSVHFINTGPSGFEMDNFSVLGTPITPPGNGLPDGGSTAALLGGTLALLSVIKRKFRE